MHQIQIIVADPDAAPETHTIEYGVIPMKTLLEGDFELVTTTRKCAVFQTKDAKRKRLPLNRVVDGRHRTYGRIVVARLGEGRGDLASLSDAEVNEWVASLG